MATIAEKRTAAPRKLLAAVVTARRGLAESRAEPAGSSATIARGRDAPNWRFVGVPDERRRGAAWAGDRSIGRGEAPV
ncbi:MAG TPA: hypothetical protein VFI22_04060, partial [Thermomicrobiales bacterium]|nr:hypothetical protein [Thermomicrobiales bacterium]